MVRACEHCGTCIDGKHESAKYCSRRCKELAKVRRRFQDPERRDNELAKQRRKRERRRIVTPAPICVDCGVEIERKPFGPPKLRCPEHEREWNRILKRQPKPQPKPKVSYLRTCDNCGERFATTHPTRKRCSEECATEYQRKRGVVLVREWGRNNPEKRAELRRHENRSRRARRSVTPRAFLLTREAWLEVLDYCGDACWWCGAEGVALTLDHVVPLSLGGWHSQGNVVPACSECNTRKSNLPLEEWLPIGERRIVECVPVWAGGAGLSHFGEAPQAPPSRTHSAVDQMAF